MPAAAAEAAAAACQAPDAGTLLGNGADALAGGDQGLFAGLPAAGARFKQQQQHQLTASAAASNLEGGLRPPAADVPLGDDHALLPQGPAAPPGTRGATAAADTQLTASAFDGFARGSGSSFTAGSRGSSPQAEEDDGSLGRCRVPAGQEGGVVWPGACGPAIIGCLPGSYSACIWQTGEASGASDLPPPGCGQRQQPLGLCSDGEQEPASQGAAALLCSSAEEGRGSGMARSALGSMVSVSLGICTRLMLSMERHKAGLPTRMRGVGAGGGSNTPGKGCPGCVRDHQQAWHVSLLWPQDWLANPASDRSAPCSSDSQPFSMFAVSQEQQPAQRGEAWAADAGGDGGSPPEALHPLALQLGGRHQRGAGWGLRRAVGLRRPGAAVGRGGC